MTVPKITRIAHSCHLLCFGEVTILLDPWFEDRPLYHPGEPRAMTPRELPPLTAIVASHAHIDHCDLAPLKHLAGSGVPVVGNRQVAAVARKHGFITESLSEGESVTLGQVRATAVPASHGCAELAFMFEADDTRIYFGGDSRLLPQHHDLAHRFGPIDVALLPTNGLRIRPLFNHRVVMSAGEAALLTASLRPGVVIPHHYAFDSGPIGNRLLTKKDTDPRRFEALVRRVAPEVPVRILATGEEFFVPERGGTPSRAGAGR